ncbi:hypothetical protein JTE90_027871 [Oedothorax gibbosus]|uniref:Ubiquitin-like domain-containing protein n=1 Tax=Oedothorax gibbosus TaxID=931172 RepID=A0AAV6U921_9ARAC|nr:hypothetical protein JTE90_027871 [Oedothorax gibbosus]
MDSDDDTSIFANRANRIFQSKSEAHEKLKNEKCTEVTKQAEADEFEDLMDKIKSKLKRKTAPRATNKRGRKAKKAKPEPDSAPVSEEDVELSVEEATPPPKRTTKRTRKLEADKEAKKAETPVRLPAPAKRRLQELKLRTDRELAQVEEEVMRTLSSCDKDCLEVSEATSLIELERNITLKIRYLSDISKISVLETEKFATIFNKVAELYNLKASEILLCLEDQNIQLEDTPLSLNLKFFDIIDCIPFKASEEQVDDPYTLLVKFQSNDKKKIEMHIHKLEKFRDFMEKYSKERDIPLKDLAFEFDGETIDGSETPEDLDMESGSCIDVRVAKSSRKEEKEKDISVIEEHIAPVPRSKMLNICVID